MYSKRFSLMQHKLCHFHRSVREGQESGFRALQNSMHIGAFCRAEVGPLNQKIKYQRPCRLRSCLLYTVSHGTKHSLDFCGSTSILISRIKDYMALSDRIKYFLICPYDKTFLKDLSFSILNPQIIQGRALQLFGSHI